MAEEQLAVGLLLHGCEPIRDVPEAEVRLFSAPLAREEGGEDGVPLGVVGEQVLPLPQGFRCLALLEGSGNPHLDGGCRHCLDQAWIVALMSLVITFGVTLRLPSRCSLRLP